MCWSRRSILQGVLSVVGAQLFVADRSRAQVSQQEFCSLAGGSLAASDVMSSSGEIQLDRALIAELNHVINIMPIGPGFKFISDVSPNASDTR